ncbi:MAG: 2-succinyl-5-enolpyruvyl-6-hydroxy-3-cyclohexene-1-carboxylic-acid synthase [Arthrobacter sp.]|uniref:2-succinyl-5-enolpyruvyl-6-hydroxy-3- cyclohexene-1-carboxylic-acid synthase n=1 Tax=Arthrobacter sp. TaxID=1667 RepID=UPI003484F58B
MRTPADDGPISLNAARSALQTLAEGGVRHLVLCPGSRSAPLAYAAAETEERGELRVHVRVDERDAGFTALGLSLASGRPVAIATTSGTAVGELLPAIMEANHAGVPLIVLSADRPEELRGTGANQTTDQPGLFGSHVRLCVDIPAGQDPAPELRRAMLTAEGIAASDGRGELPGLGGVEGISVHAVARGPVHLNIAFRDPLVPGPGAALASTRGSAPDSGSAGGAGGPQRGESEDGEPQDRGTETEAGPRDEAFLTPIEDLPERRTVVIAGHDAGPVAEEFARRHGLPLLAEPSSNARFGPHAVGPYRLLLAPFESSIERVVVFGRPTLSRPVERLLAGGAVPAALYVPEPVGWFDVGRRLERIIDEPEDLSLFAGRGAPGWLDAWLAAGAAAERSIAGVLDAGPMTGLLLAREVWAASRGALVIGSSNAIRDADLAGQPAGAPAARIFANRGLAGIDGTVATATGVALARGEGRTTLLLGDVTFLHDVGGLFLGDGEFEPDLDVVVLNDGGGAIFSTLEHGLVAESGHYGSTVERFFGTPHRVRLDGLAAAYGLDYVRVDDPAALRAVLDARAPGESGGRTRRRIVDVAIDRTDVRALHRRIASAVAAAVAPIAAGATAPDPATAADPPASPDPATARH